MSSSAVQPSMGTESSMRHVDKQMFDLRVNSAGQESPTPLSSVSVSSMIPMHPRCQELSESEFRITTNGIDANFMCHPNNTSLLPPAEPSGGQHQLASSRAEGHILVRDKGRSNFTTGISMEHSGQAQTQGDTATATKDMNGSSHRHAVRNASSLLSTGSSVDGPENNFGLEETAKACSKLQGNSTAETANVQTWLGKPDTSAMFPGNSTAEDILKELGITRSTPQKNAQSTANFENTHMEKSNINFNFGSYKFDSRKDNINFDSAKLDFTSTVLDNSEPGKAAQVKSESKPYMPHQREISTFESSDLAFRLRSSLQSDFLSKELRSAGPSAGDSQDVAPICNPGARSIDKILMDHGLTEEIRGSKDTKGLAGAGLHTKFPSSSVTVDASQNNESNKSLKRGSEGGTQEIRKDSSTIPAPSGMNMPVNTANFLGTSGNYAVGTPNYTVNSSKTLTSCSMEAKSNSKSFNSWSMNLSQNNETTASKANNPEQDTVRKFGSPVDFKIERSSMFMPTTTTTTTMSSKMGRYDYGTTLPFSGDTGYTKPTSPKYKFMDSYRYDNSYSKTPASGLYSSMNFSTSRDNYTPKDKDNKGKNIGEGSYGLGSNYELINSIGTRADVLDYSMHQERQRLKNIDAMISTTPFYSRPVDMPKSYSSKYLSSDPKDVTSRRLYSSPTLNTYPTYNNELYSRKSWTTGVGQQGQRDRESYLGKSSSVPAYPDLQMTKQIGSSVDLPRPGSSRNLQYNNSSRGQKKPAKSKCEKSEKKAEFGLVNMRKSSTSQGKTQGRGLHKDKGDKTKAGVPQRRPAASKGNVSNQSGTDLDLNVSKAVTNIHSGYEFVKDLNRIWTQSVLGEYESSAQSPKPRPPKYQPYTPKATKEKKSTDNNDSTKCFYSRDLSQVPASKIRSHWPDYSKSTMPSMVNYSSSIGPANAHLAKSYSSIEGAARTWEKTNRFTSPSRKEREHSANPETSFGMGSLAPKSILKPGKSGVTRPQSGPSSRPNVKPNQLVKGYSPVGSYSYGHSFSANKKAESKGKASSKSTSSIQKKGRRH